MALTILETTKAATKLTHPDPIPPTALPVTPVTPVTGINEFLTWRVQQLEQRLAEIDKNGTHGTATITLLVETLQKNFQDHEAEHKEVAKEQRIGRRWLIGVLVAAIVPLYPFIGIILFRKY